MKSLLVAAGIAAATIGTANAKQLGDFDVPMSIVKRAIKECYDALTPVDAGIRWDDCVLGQVARWHKAGKYIKLTIAE